MLATYSGLCGTGKTTLIAQIALEKSKLIEKNKTTKRFIFTNVDLKDIPHVFHIDFDMVGIYDLHDAFILIDEASIFMDSRDFKNIKRSLLDYLALHRHYNVDIYAFFQCIGSVDKRFRTLSEKTYVVRRCALFGKWFTKVIEIPYCMLIPDKGEKMGDIIEGYHMPNIFGKLFCKRIFRPLYYKYFDSFTRPLALKKLVLKGKVIV